MEIKAKKSLGQNFLQDETVLKNIANSYTLKGLFAKEILKEKEIAKDEELEIIEKAVEIAFEALE